MKVVHYTRDKAFQLRPIKIENSWIKPTGGLWASPIEVEENWKAWCEQEEFGNIGSQTRVEMEIDTSKFLIINSVADLKRLSWEPHHALREIIDFQVMKADGIDGIYLTAEGQWATRLTHPRHLYGWDCECILIMNERCIQSYRVEK